ncbi:hypothetical protein CEXT_430371 [Caerostris extrusa]|uniref:Uncharacterized protein n=1 Tax=Caerostris extrusa TaxID=172846 RepID=A0AAV4XQB6_CAEEX|nr:hypothetical protein CEXT_430371 [Caerostris extrusa]
MPDSWLRGNVCHCIHLFPSISKSSPPNFRTPTKVQKWSPNSPEPSPSILTRKARSSPNHLPLENTKSIPKERRQQGASSQWSKHVSTLPVTCFSTPFEQVSEIPHSEPREKSRHIQFCQWND